MYVASDYAPVAVSGAVLTYVNQRVLGCKSCFFLGVHFREMCWIMSCADISQVSSEFMSTKVFSMPGCSADSPLFMDQRRVGPSCARDECRKPQNI